MPRYLPSRILLWTVVIPLLAAAYFGAAKLGLSLAPPAVDQVTVVWPPTGIALAAVVLFGFRVWPAIAIGAFLANITTHETIGAACGITAGNTLEALAAGWLLAKVAHFDARLNRVSDVLALVLLAAVVSTALAATVGATSLCLGGVHDWSEFGSLWALWWVGDAMGNLVVAPFLLAWAFGWRRSERLAEAGLLSVCLAAVFWFGFITFSGGASWRRALAYCVFPLLIWAAVRFGQRGATLVTLIATTIGIWSTVNGLGPFGGADRLLTLTLFAGVMSMSGLLLGAALAERETLDRELRLRVQQLNDADRRKDEFLATLAHELRNPLAPIQTALEIFSTPGIDKATLSQVEEILGRQVRHLARLVDDLLDTARISRGKIELRKERVELAAIVSRAVETVRPLVDARRHELDVSLPAEPLWLDADPTRIAQVIGNLLNNAAKYSERRGHIWLSAGRDGPTVVVQVRDDGMGISPDVLPSIFDLFVQGDAGRDRTQGGMGIGLTLVRRLVELHGGAVEAASRGPGQGSEFTIRLPAASDLSAASPAANGASPAEAPADRTADRPIGPVLIVDDNADAARTLEELLRNRYFDVHAVFDGQTALSWAEARPPAVVLLDIGMPKMDGYEVARQLRRQPGGREILLIALTGWGQEEDRRLTAEAGFDAHLVKPTTVAAIEQLIDARLKTGQTPAGAARS